VLPIQYHRWFWLAGFNWGTFYSLLRSPTSRKGKKTPKWHRTLFETVLQPAASFLTLFEIVLQHAASFLTLFERTLQPAAGFRTLFEAIKPVKMSDKPMLGTFLNHAARVIHLYQLPDT
jgi:hypothetical protein